MDWAGARGLCQARAWALVARTLLRPAIHCHRVTALGERDEDRADGNASGRELGEDLGSRRGSIGAYLARQRRLRGISLENLCELTRIPQRSLERLEQGAFDRHPDGFARGFVRTVAAALGLDPDDTVTRMLDEPTVAANRESSRRARAWGIVLAGAVLALAVASVGLVTWKLDGSRDLAPEREPAEVTRRDPVRALAEAQGIQGLAPARVAAPARAGERN